MPVTLATRSMIVDWRGMARRPHVAFSNGYGSTGDPPAGCTSKWRWGAPPAASPVLPT